MTKRLGADAVARAIRRCLPSTSGTTATRFWVTTQRHRCPGVVAPFIAAVRVRRAGCRSPAGCATQMLALTGGSCCCSVGACASSLADKLSLQALGRSHKRTFLRNASLGIPLGAGPLVSMAVSAQVLRDRAQQSARTAEASTITSVEW